MNKITKEDYKDLIGALLEGIQFGKGDVGFYFFKEIRIVHRNKLELINNRTGEVQTWEDSKPKGCICLNPLLDETITSYDINGRGDFTLNFSNGCTVILYNDFTWDDIYEITIGSKYFFSGDNVTEF